MGVNDDRECPLCGADTRVDGKHRNCTDCHWYVLIGGVSA